MMSTTSVVVDGAARGCGAGDSLVRAAVEHAAPPGAVFLLSLPDYCFFIFIEKQ